MSSISTLPASPTIPPEIQVLLYAVENLTLFSDATLVICDSFPPDTSLLSVIEQTDLQESNFLEFVVQIPKINSFQTFQNTSENLCKPLKSFNPDPEITNFNEISFHFCLLPPKQKTIYLNLYTNEETTPEEIPSSRKVCVSKDALDPSLSLQESVQRSLSKLQNYPDYSSVLVTNSDQTQKVWLSKYSLYFSHPLKTFVPSENQNDNEYQLFVHLCSKTFPCACTLSSKTREITSCENCGLPFEESYEEDIVTSGDEASSESDVSTTDKDISDDDDERPPIKIPHTPIKTDNEIVICKNSKCKMRFFAFRVKQPTFCSKCLDVSSAPNTQLGSQIVRYQKYFLSKDLKSHYSSYLAVIHSTWNKKRKRFLTKDEFKLQLSSLTEKGLKLITEAQNMLFSCHLCSQGKKQFWQSWNVCFKCNFSNCDQHFDKSTGLCKFCSSVDSSSFNDVVSLHLNQQQLLLTKFEMLFQSLKNL